LKHQLLNFGEVVNRFKDDQIDAGFVVAGLPTAALMDLTTTKTVSLINFDKEMMERVIAAYPFFIPNVIPGGTYRGIDHDVHTPAVMALLITHDGMSEDIIYNFLKGMFDNIADIQASHAMARNITLENASKGLTAPMHPGAVKFYKEKGIIK
jgi:TRAP transporter TAXI family solute receptor